MMNLIDITILYLTCGAPFGVYYFYQQREYIHPLNLLTKSILITLFWIPYAIKVLHRVVTKRLLNIYFVENNSSDSNIDDFEKKFSKILLDSKVEIPLFEFREIFERYVGLTKEISFETIEGESDLFRISKHENNKLASKILSRRNRARLFVHQTLARQDFLRVVKQIDSILFNQENVRNLTIDFVKLINDVEAQTELQKLFQKPTQSQHGFTVNQMEEVWNPTETKQLPTPAKTLNFRTLSATATTLKPD